MSGRTPFVAGNWKMHKTASETGPFVRELAGRLPEGVEVAVCVPFTSLAPAVEAAAGSPLRVYAQNMHQAAQGAFTGEVSAAMLLDLGVHGVLLGHSERRTHFNETDATVNLKVRAVLRHGLIPLVCVGEPDEVFRQGGSSEYVVRQAHLALDQVDDVSGVLIAYEPVWAIGEGGRPANPEDIESQFAALTEALQGRVRGILYGGSVNPDNAAETLAVPGVDGLFVGRSAWEVEGYLRLVDLAARSRERAPAEATPTPTGHDGDGRKS